MLAECRKKAERLGIVNRCLFVKADLFAGEVLPQVVFDSALIGFLVSHISEADEHVVFESLRRMLEPSGEFLILDSAWSDLRAQFNGRIEQQERRVNDGRKFEIYKRYIDRTDIEPWVERFRIAIRIEHFGPALCALSGRFEREPNEITNYRSTH
jgi:ubiquinone/menaquinone biosynthesis C-methylase UbiE